MIPPLLCRRGADEDPHTDGHCHPNADSDAHLHRHGDPHKDPDRLPHRHANPDCHPYCHGHGHTAPHVQAAAGQSPGWWRRTSPEKCCLPGLTPTATATYTVQYHSGCQRFPDFTATHGATAPAVCVLRLNNVKGGTHWYGLKYLHRIGAKKVSIFCPPTLPITIWVLSSERGRGHQLILPF